MSFQLLSLSPSLRRSTCPPPGENTLFAPSQSIRALVSGAGLSHVSICFQDIQNSISFTMLSVDTLDVDIDRTTRSWSISTSSWECPRQLAQLPIRIVLDFVTHKQFDCFLFALSYVRFIDGRSSLGIFSLSLAKAREIVMVEDDESSIETLSTHFVIMRTIPGDKCSVHTLPVELISLIFIPYIAVQIPELWRDPRFPLGPSFFHNRDNHHPQMASWLTRAKSSGIALALAVRTTPYLFCRSAPLLRSVQIDNCQRLTVTPEFNAGFGLPSVYQYLLSVLLSRRDTLSFGWTTVLSKTAVTFSHLTSLQVTLITDHSRKSTYR
ncbi:hypothetical protein B0H11DRAFT_2240353 [Mycena galericulata]|nr:hypothetical protein B0H11DRAFT_2240353 [Mycena galericulata]